MNRVNVGLVVKIINVKLIKAVDNFYYIMLIDTHAHINFKDYKNDSDEVMKRALENNIWIINVAADFETSKKAIELAEKYPKGIFAAVGLHPISINEEKFDYEKYKELAQKEKVVAIGETGLDYAVFIRKQSERLEKEVFVKTESRSELYQKEIEIIKNLQKALFKKHIELAIELNKPLIIHCRNSHEDLIKMLKAKSYNLKTNLKGVIHCFSGNLEQAKEYRKLGFKIGLNGIITFSRDYDEVILGAPIEDILLETDCPYLAPVPYRGKRNEPLYIIEVAKKLAEIKNLSLENVIKQTTRNANNLFNF